MRVLIAALLAINGTAIIVSEGSLGDLVACLTVSSSKVLLPDSPSYLEYAVGTNLRYDDLLPMAVVNATTVEDIRSTLLCSKKHELGFTVRGGGHSFEGASSRRKDGVLVILDSFNAVREYDALAGSITIESGMRLGKLYGEVISRTNTSVIAGGTCATVGVVGHMLCGGYGYLGRAIGLTSDQVVQIEMLTSEGDLVTSSQNGSNPELFWALRGSCMSAFGIITSITLRLTPVASDKITIIDLPSSSLDGAEAMLQWWQTYATVEAPSAFTSTLTFSKTSAKFRGVYLGNAAQAQASVLPQIVAGFSGLLTEQEVEAGVREGSFLDAVLFWSSDPALTSLDDLLAIHSLPSLESRQKSTISRRKAKSYLPLRPLSASAFETIRELFASGKINQMEFKAYGGVVPAGRAFTDDRSPLWRGHIFETHWGSSHSTNTSLSPAEQHNLDSLLVQGVEEAAAILEPLFGTPYAYPGYIDLNIVDPGKQYFGDANARKLRKMQKKWDPKGYLRSPASDYLLSPPRLSSLHFVGSFGTSTITSWRLSSGGSGVEEEKFSLSLIGSVTALPNAVWLQRGQGQTKDILYACHEISDYQQKQSGAISAFRILDDGSLTLINSQSSSGGSPNFLHVHALTSRQVVYVANACNPPSVGVIAIDAAGGGLGDVVQTVSFGGANGCVADQPFLHMVTVHPSGDVLFAVDRNDDSVFIYRLLPDGLIDESSKVVLKLAAGTGPRHLAFSSSGAFVFILGETANTLAVVRLDDLAVLATYSTLRADESGQNMAAAEVAVGRCGDADCVYATNRDISSDPNLGRSSVAVFRVVGEDKQGQSVSLALVQHVFSGGIHPRSFEILPAGSLAVVSNKDSHNAVVFDRSSSDGSLTLLDAFDVLPEAPQPVQFL